MLLIVRFTVAAGLLVSIGAGSAPAGESGASQAGCDVCVATVAKEKVEKHCWRVECEKICVPKVVCPWDEGGSGLTCFDWLKKKSGPCCCGEACGNAGCCPKPRCGKVICVRDLKKETYECEACVCKWEIRRLPPCGGNGCGEGCGCGATLGDASGSGLAGETAPPVRNAAAPTDQPTTRTELNVTADDRVSVGTTAKRPRSERRGVSLAY